MNFEKYVNSKFYHITEKLALFILVNMIALLISSLSFFILTFPSIVAVYCVLLDDINKHESSSILGSYFTYWKKHFKKAMILELIVAVTVGFLVFNFNTYVLNEGLIFTIGLYVMIVLAVFIIPIYLNLFLVVAYFPQLTTKETLRVSFYIGYRFPLSTILVIVAFMPLVGLMISFYNLIPFVGISISIYLSLLFTRKVYNRFTYNTTEEEER